MMGKIKKFIYEVRLELKNVSYPKPKELWGSTWVVIVASIILGVFVFIVDTLFSQGMGRLLR